MQKSVMTIEITLDIIGVSWGGGMGFMDKTLSSTVPENDQD